MRIIVDTVAATSGGGLSRTRELARTFPTLAPQNEYLFVAQRATARAILEIAPTAAVVSPGPPLGRSPLRLGWEHLILPARDARRFRPDVVFSPFNVAPTVWPSPRPKLAVIVSNLAPFSDALRAMYRGAEALRLMMLRRLTARTLERADRVFVLSAQAFDMIDERLLAGKTELIPMAPPPEPGLEADDSSRATPREPFFLIVTDVLRYKGIEVVLDALGHLEQDARPLVLVAGGMLDRPYVRDLERRSASLGIGSHLRMIGSIAHKDVLSLMRASVGCIISSRFENGGRVPVEAMSLGVPLIASDIPAFREVCGPAAAYFDLEDPPQLARQMRLLVEDRELRKRLARGGYERLEAVEVASASQRILSSLAALDGAPSA